MIKGLKICGISDPETLNFILNHEHPAMFIGFISNYKKSKRYVDHENLKKLLNTYRKTLSKTTGFCKRFFIYSASDPTTSSEEGASN